MRVVVTGSSGHLGEALMRTLRAGPHEVVGVDILPSPFTEAVGSIADPDFASDCLRGADAVIHAATLHKPHVETHARRAFVDTNVVGTLTLLEAAAAAGVGAFVFTSTTSVFGRALTPADGEPAVWVTEDLAPRPHNVYSATKLSAELLCELVHRQEGLPCLILRTSRFFPEVDDRAETRRAYADANLKTNELLHRRVDLEDAVDAHLLAVEHAPRIGFERYVISATTPFEPEDVRDLRADAAVVVGRRVPGWEAVYAERRWRMYPAIERVYVNERARRELGWRPRWSFRAALERVAAGEEGRSPLAVAVGSKGYHAETSARWPLEQPAG
jgi:nucleoside-diphosphate-sugar epimerase